MRSGRARSTPLLSKLEKGGWLACETRIVEHKQRKYYRLTSEERTLIVGVRKKIKEPNQAVIEG